MELSSNPYSFDPTVNQNNQNFPSSMEIEEWKALPPLPNELAAHIFSFLDVKTLYLLSRISKKISGLALEALKLKLRLFGEKFSGINILNRSRELIMVNFLKI